MEWMAGNVGDMGGTCRIRWKASSRDVQRIDKFRFGLWGPTLARHPPPSMWMPRHFNVFLTSLPWPFWYIHKFTYMQFLHMLHTMFPLIHIVTCFYLCFILCVHQYIFYMFLPMLYTMFPLNIFFHVSTYVSINTFFTWSYMFNFYLCFILMFLLIHICYLFLHLCFILYVSINALTSLHTWFWCVCVCGSYNCWWA